MSSNLSDGCETRIAFLFPNPTEREYVRVALRETCGRNLPGCERSTTENLDRVRFAVLKLSAGTIEKLDRAIELAQTDFRDLLVAADFATSVDAHLEWDPSERESAT